MNETLLDDIQTCRHIEEWIRNYGRHTDIQTPWRMSETFPDGIQTCRHTGEWMRIYGWLFRNLGWVRLFQMACRHRLTGEWMRIYGWHTDIHTPWRMSETFPDGIQTQTHRRMNETYSLDAHHQQLAYRRDGSQDWSLGVYCFTCCHTETERGRPRLFVAAGNIILTPTQPVGNRAARADR